MTADGGGAAEGRPEAGAETRAETQAVARAEPAAFDRRMLEALVCPVTQAVLTWDPVRQELVSRAAGLAFPVRDGIPVMLVGEARALD